MLTSVQASGIRPSLDPLVMSIADAMSDDIQIINIDGLEPVTAAIASSPRSNIRGESFGSPSVGKRNIVLTLGYNPDWSNQTMEGLRQTLYKYFMPELSVDLEFVSTHLPTCGISGVVEDMKPNLFSSDPQIVISILCEDPDFVAVAPTIVSGAMVLGHTTDFIEYEGTQPTGFVLTIDTNPLNVSYVGNLTFASLWDDTEIFQINGVTIDATYYFELSTVPGNKYVHKVTVANPAIYTSLLNLVVGTPDWIQLYPGENEFQITATEAGQDYTITYFARFGGL